METPASYKLTKIATLSGHTNRLWCCSWSPGGTALATSGSDGTVRIWKRETSINSNQPTNTTKPPSGILFTQLLQDPALPSSCQQCLVEAPVSTDSPVNTDDLAISYNDWICIQVLNPGTERTVRSIAWSPSGRHIALASFDHTIIIYELVNGSFECVATLEGHESEVKWVNFSSSGEQLVSCSRDKSVWVWQGDGDNEWECVSVLTGHSQDVKMACFHPVTDDIYSASYDNTVRVWSAQDDDWYPSMTFADHSATVWAFSFETCGRFLATTSGDCSLITYRFDEKAPTHKCWTKIDTVDACHDRTPYTLSWSKPFLPPTAASPANSPAPAQVFEEAGVKRLGAQYGYVATGGGDDDVCVFELATENGESYKQRLALRMKAHDGDVNTVAWNPKVSNLLATGGDDNLVHIWRFERV